jgi:hypothetical protein
MDHHPPVNADFGPTSIADEMAWSRQYRPEASPQGAPEKDMPIAEFAATLALIGAMRAVDFIGDLAAKGLHHVQGG